MKWLVVILLGVWFLSKYQKTGPEAQSLHKAQLLQRLQAAYMSQVGDPNYDSGVDFNHDGVVNVADFAILAAM